MKKMQRFIAFILMLVMVMTNMPIYADAADFEEASGAAVTADTSDALSASTAGSMMDGIQSLSLSADEGGSPVLYATTEYRYVWQTYNYTLSEGTRQTVTSWTTPISEANKYGGFSGHAASLSVFDKIKIADYPTYHFYGRPYYSSDITYGGSNLNVYANGVIRSMSVYEWPYYKDGTNPEYIAYKPTGDWQLNWEIENDRLYCRKWDNATQRYINESFYVIQPPKATKSGSAIATLSASYSSKYPNNALEYDIYYDRNRAYYYEYKGYDNILPSSVTITNPVQGQKVTATVTPRTGTYGGTQTYKYYYKYNGGDWKLAGSSTSTSYQITVPTNAKDFQVGVYVSDGMGYTSSSIVTSAVKPCTAPAYTITFDANGGSPATATRTTSTSVASKGKVSSLPSSPTKANHVFKGWYTAKSGGKEVTATYTFSGNTTVYAQWIPIYTITFDANGGSPASTTLQTGNTSSTQGKISSFPENPTRLNYAFAGWFNGDIQVSSNYTFTGNTTLTAKWIPIYMVTFNANGGQLIDGAVQQTGGTADTQGLLSALPNDPTRPNYAFDGWYDQASGGSKVTLKTEFTQNTTVYAQWLADVYQLTLNPNGGTCETGSISTNPREFGKLNIESLPIPTRPSCTFLGWFTSASVGEEITVDTSITQNTVAYAHWQIDQQTITLDANGGTVMNEDDSEVPTLEILTSATNPGCVEDLPIATNRGYMFLGWFTEQTGGEKVTTDTVFSGPATIYARWTEGGARYSALDGSGVIEYPSFEEAWNHAAENDGIVTLMNDVGVDDTYSFGSGVGFGNGQSGSGADNGYISVPMNAEIVLDLNGYKINRGLLKPKAMNGYVIYVNTNAQLTIKDSVGTGQISGGWNNTSINGGGIYNKGSLEITGGTISDNGGGKGGGIYNEGLLAISGATQIVNNSANSNGGGIFSKSGDGFTVSDSVVISGNSAAKGGGIYVESGTLRMDGEVEITNNTAATSGGGVHINTLGTLILTSGSITGNVSTDGGGIFQGGTLELKGGGSITENIAKGKPNNIYLDSNKVIKFSGAIQPGFLIGVTTEKSPTESTPVTLTSGWSTAGVGTNDIKTHVVSDNEYAVEINSSGTELQVGMPNYTCEITFDANGGVCDTSSAMTQRNGKLSSLPVPTREYYQFTGWFTEPTGGTQVTEAMEFRQATTVYAQWSIETYTITYSLDNGIVSDANPATYTQASSFTLNNPEKTGYEFKGWTGTGLSAMTSHVMVPEGSMGARNYVANYDIITYDYKVEYYLQNVTQDGYDLDKSDTFSDVENASVTAEAIAYKGFTLADEQPDISGNVTSDGALVLKIYYDRNVYNIKTSDDEDAIASEYVYGSDEFNALQADAKPGYDFAKWVDELYNPVTFDEPVASVIGPSYTPRTDTAYQVIHYQQNVMGDEYTAFDTQNLTGTTGTDISAEPNEYEGFTVSTKKESVTQGVISGNGDTVLKVYYDRNEYRVSLDGDVMSATTYRYGDPALESLVAESKPGYDFVEWVDDDGAIDFIRPANGVIVPRYQAHTNVAYKVEHYVQLLDGSDYDESPYRTEDFTGTTDAPVNAVPMDEAGFVLNPGAKGSAASGMIAGDGSLVLKLYYDREEYDVTFETGTEDVIASQTVRYGNLVTEPVEVLTKPGYEFKGWLNDGSVFDFESTLITEDTTLTADWVEIGKVSYSVEHYLQNVTDDEYTLDATETPSDYDGAEVTATHDLEKYTGFHAAENGNVTSGTLDQDGAAVVLKLYYDRDVFTVDFVTGVAQSVDSQQVRYGGYIQEPELELTNNGKIFGGWSTDGSSVFDFETNKVTSNLTLTAIWKDIASAQYDVEHYQQNLDDDEYTKFETTTGEGSVGDTVTAQEQTYTGFHLVSRPESVTSGIVTDETSGKLVLKLYYDRDVFTVDFVTGTSDAVDAQQVRYGGKVQEPDDVLTNGDKIFGGWTYQDGQPFNFESYTVTENLTLTAVWNDPVMSGYDVEYYQQNVNDDGYTRVQTTSHEAAVGASVAAEQVPYTGFHIITHSDSVVSGVVTDESEGRLTLKLYYDRDMFTVTFNPGNGEQANMQQVRYEGTAVLPKTPVRTGFIFQGWEDSAGHVFDGSAKITQNVTVNAKWLSETGVTYVTEYYLFNPIDEAYVKQETATNAGAAGEQVSAEIKSFTGYEFNSSAANVLNGTLTEGKSLVLQVYYDPIMLDITLDYANGEPNGTVQVLYSDRLVVPAKPEKQGYEFHSWQKDGMVYVFANPVYEAFTLTATYTPRTDTPYTIEYYGMDTDGETYSRMDSETVQRQGTTDSEVTVSGNDVKTFNGLTLNTEQSIMSGTVAADGSLVLKLYYDRDMVQVNIVDGISGAILDTEYVISGGTLAEPAEPTKPGYVFAGWEDADGNPFDFSAPILDTGVTVRVIAAFDPATDTQYTVERYFQTADGREYILDSSKTEILTGTTGSEVHATVTVYDGFQYNASHAGQIASGIVAADGSLVLKLYYDREGYTVVFDMGDGERTTVAVPVGQTVPRPTDPVRAGYVFGGWLLNGAAFDFDTVITDNLTLTAKWLASTDILYRVEHYRQTKTGYELFETETLKGATGEQVTAQPKTYAGYYENTTHANRVPSGTVAADGSLVLKLYYDQVQYVVTFDTGDSVQQVSVGQGDTVTKPATPTKNGYMFVCWLNNGVEFDFTTPITSNLTLTAKWEPKNDTKYYVQHYRQNADHTGYVLYETETLMAATGATVSAIPTKYFGYHENKAAVDRVVTGTVTGDGALILKLYYDHNTLFVTLNVDGKTTVIQGQYGETLDAPAEPKKEGYTFDGWVKANGAKFDFSKVLTGDITLYADWTPMEGIAYRVRHYWQTVDGEDYELHEVETLAKYAGASVKAAANDYDGFTVNKSESELTGTVKEDGSLVLSVYYDREEVEVLVDTNNGAKATTMTVLYGGTLEKPKTPSKSGYDFVAWVDEDGEVFDFDEPVTDGLTIKAKWASRNDDIVDLNPDGSVNIGDSDLPLGVPNTGIVNQSGMLLAISVLFMLLAISSGIYLIIQHKKKEK